MNRETSKGEEFMCQPGLRRDKGERGTGQAELPYPEVRSDREGERTHAKEFELV
jgi:hypothetical protein